MSTRKNSSFQFPAQMGAGQITSQCWCTLTWTSFFPIWQRNNCWNLLCCSNRNSQTVKSTSSLPGRTHLPSIHGPPHSNPGWFSSTKISPFTASFKKNRQSFAYLRAQWQRICASWQPTNYSPTGSYSQPVKKSAYSVLRHWQNDEPGKTDWRV